MQVQQVPGRLEKPRPKVTREFFCFWIFNFTLNGAAGPNYVSLYVPLQLMFWHDCRSNLEKLELNNLICKELFYVWIRYNAETLYCQKLILLLYTQGVTRIFVWCWGETEELHKVKTINEINCKLKIDIVAQMMLIAQHWKGLADV